MEVGGLFNPETKKSTSSINFSIFVKPKNGNFRIYLERQTSISSGQGGVLVELNYLIKQREKKLKSLNKTKYPKRNLRKYPMVDPPKNTRRL